MSWERIKELRDERFGLHEKAHALLGKAESENRDLTPEEDQQWEAMQSDMDTLAKRIERMERDERVGAHNAAQPGAEDRHSDDEPERPEKLSREAEDTRKFYRFITGRDGARDNEITVRMRPHAAEIPADLPEDIQRVMREERAQSVGVDAEGGYTVPQGFSGELEKALLQFGAIRQSRVRVLQTATGNQIDWPTLDDTSNKGVLLAENTADAEQDLVFSTAVLDAYKYTSRIIRISKEIAQDSAFNMDSEIAQAFGQRLGRIMNEHATTGTGTGQPNGVVTASALGVTAASSSAITHDELLDLKHSVDPAYRQQAEWMFNDTTLKVLKKLKDSQNRPLWLPGIAVSEPDTLDSDPFVINQDMPDMEASGKSVLYGDFSRFIIRDVLSMQMVRLVERYAEFHQFGFIAIMRFDSELIDAGGGAIKHMIHPSP